MILALGITIFFCAIGLSGDLVRIAKAIERLSENDPPEKKP